MDPSRARAVPVLPAANNIALARRTVFQTLPPDHGLGDEVTREHLENDIVPGLNGSSQSANYYGFVTGGATPSAAVADNIVTQYDQNVQVHLPNDSIATDVEHEAAIMVGVLLDLDVDDWRHRTFTTGATASNLLGLACGREYVIEEAAKKLGKTASVADDGLLNAMRRADLDNIQILTTVPHSSLYKTASIVGLGRSSIIDVSQKTAPHLFNLALLEHHLSQPRTASIVVISCSEVNTGLFATTTTSTPIIRHLCNKYSAWLHVDAAFGALARILPCTPSYHSLTSGTSCLPHADSITADAHKLLNVPYDCGIYLSRHLNTSHHVFHNPNAAYLKSLSPSTSEIPSPLNLRIENSARFRALPVYATLVAYGRQGYVDMLERQVGLAREIAGYVLDSDRFELLPEMGMGREERLREIYIIVLFRARDEEVNGELVQRINGTRRIYVSGTQWEGRPATRFAVSNWQVDVERDMKLIREVLESVVP